jgi:hypothetical protein
LTTNKIFLALGNDRPQILIDLEDYVLHAIIDISEGKATEDVIEALYLQIQSREKDLGINRKALNWFDLSNHAALLPTQG